MPTRNVIKPYVREGYYHLYNRGVEKRNIFNDDRDYRVFLSCLKQSLDAGESEKSGATDLSDDIDLIAYCLMPNHYHLFVQQHSDDGIAKLMRSINTRYTMYFNHRWGRVGRLFQGTYKAALVVHDSQLMHLTRYIHLNPLSIRRNYEIYPYSSYKFYLSQPPAWLKPERALELFEHRDEYADFVSGLARDSRQELSDIAID